MKRHSFPHSFSQGRRRAKYRTRWTSRLRGLFPVVLLAASVFAVTFFTRAGTTFNLAPRVALASDSSYFLAQTQPENNRVRGRTDARRPGVNAARSRTRSERNDSRRDQRNAIAPDTKAAPTPTPPREEPETAAATSDGSFVRQLATWVRGWAVPLVILLVVLIVGVYFVMGRRTAGAAEKAFQDLDTNEEAAAPRYSTTKIKAKDVNARLDDGEVETTQVETDREYALVVDEEALKQRGPDEIDRHTGQAYADSSEIERMLQTKSYDDAYRAYIQRIKTDGSAEFHSELEKSLSDHFLQRREFKKAGRVLEHHVATHAPEDIDSETYFNLGYIHFFNRTMNKSRRFMKLYVDSAKTSRNATRALRIIAYLDKIRSS